MVDALDSKSNIRKSVKVQVLSPVLFRIANYCLQLQIINQLIVLYKSFTGCNYLQDVITIKCRGSFTL